MGQLAQCLRDHAELAPHGQPPEWQDDEELVEGELLCLLASGVLGWVPLLTTQCLSLDAGPKP